MRWSLNRTLGFEVVVGVVVVCAVGTTTVSGDDEGGKHRLAVVGLGAVEEVEEDGRVGLGAPDWQDSGGRPF